MIPTQVKKMIAKEGVYLVQHPTNKGYSVVHVSEIGVCEQMAFDGVLVPERWHPDVVVRGPLTLDMEPIAGDPPPAPPVPPVDRSAKTLTDGTPVTEDHRDINPATGQQKGYVVLSDEERAKGFVRPVRNRYVHDKALGGCGSTTVMGRTLAETYARDPSFYSGTFCVNCKAHFPVGEDGEFIWFGTNEKVGT